MAQNVTTRSVSWAFERGTGAALTGGMNTDKNPNEMTTDELYEALSGGPLEHVYAQLAWDAFGGAVDIEAIDDLDYKQAEMTWARAGAL